jgi:hypothetical protein
MSTVDEPYILQSSSILFFNYATEYILVYLVVTYELLLNFIYLGHERSLNMLALEVLQCTYMIQTLFGYLLQI